MFFSYTSSSAPVTSKLSGGTGGCGGLGPAGDYVQSSLSASLRPSAQPAVAISAAVSEKRQARVLYDYDAADCSELSLLADEVNIFPVCDLCRMPKILTTAATLQAIAMPISDLFISISYG